MRQRAKEQGQVDRSSASSLTHARSGTDTTVVAVMSSWTQQGDESTTEHWWLDLVDMGYLVLLPRHGQRETRVRQRSRGWRNRKPRQPSAGKWSKTRQSNTVRNTEQRLSGMVSSVTGSSASVWIRLRRRAREACRINSGEPLCCDAAKGAC